MTVVRSGQRVFRDVIAEYLQRIDYAADGYARLIRLPAYERADVVVDPTRSFDCHAACADLEARGVALINGPINREWGQRTACFADPDGHIWELAQNLS